VGACAATSGERRAPVLWPPMSPMTTTVTWPSR
jgi:hypothetical protein